MAKHEQFRTSLDLCILPVSLFLLISPSPGSIEPQLDLSLPCHFFNYLYRILSTFKSSVNHSQEFDFIFPLILALCVANLIFSYWPVSQTYCIKQFEQLIKYIVLDVT